MKRIWKLFMAVSLMALTMLFVSACSDGGGGGASSTTLKGTAAAGAPIIGKVTIRDSSAPVALEKTVDIEADGNYSVDVTGLKAPYMVRADGYVGGNEYHLYSAATQEDVGHTVNITPLTDLIVANIANTVASDYFTSGNFSTLTAAQLTAEADALKAKLLPTLQAIGVAGSIDLLRSSFSTDHTGLDAALDMIRVSTDPATNIATITNIVTQQQMTSNLATGTYTGALDNTAGVATAATDIQKISAGFTTFSNLFATSLPSEVNPTLLGLFDSTTFMQGGQSLASFLSEMTTEQSLIGISFTNITIKSMDMAKNTALVGFDVIQNGKIQSDAPDAWYMIKKNDGKWYMQGDQRIADVSIESRAEYRPSDMGTKIYTGLTLDIEDRGGKGITSAVVTGKGLTGPVTLVNEINNDWFTIQGMNSGNLYVMNDNQIGAIADSGEVYTIDLYKGASKVASYTEKLKKRPYLNTALTAASFPVITSPTVAQLRSFTGGNATVTWTIPAGLTNDWLEAQIGDNSGNYARFEASLLPTDTSKSFTLNPVTNGGQNFTVTQGWLWLSVFDSYGRTLAVSLW